MARNLIIAPGEFYHIYNRGNDKRNIFSSIRDYERFLTLLYVSNGEMPVRLQRQGSTLKDVHDIDCGKKLINLCAYCLMPNHFHLLVRGLTNNGISTFMQKLTTAYTMYFDKRYERSGSLFQGRFKAIHVHNDRYLKYVIAYIHLNPIKLVDSNWKEAGIKDINKAETYLEKYRYSSYLDYTRSTRLENCIINKEALPKYFNTAKDVKDYSRDLLMVKVEP